MKRIKTAIKILLVAILALALFLNMCVAAFAENAQEITDNVDNGEISDAGQEDSEETDDHKENSAWIELDGGIRLGSEFTVVLTVNSPSVFAYNGSFTYNHQLIELVGVDCLLDNWSCSKTVQEGNITFLAVDTLLSYAAEGENELLALTFRLSDQVQQGDLLEFTCSEISISDGQSDGVLSGGALNAAVGRALSSKAELKGISGDFVLSPEFSSDVYSYSATVSGDTQTFEASLELDEFAKAEISSDQLAVGENTVVITVISEDGTQSAEYVINVTRGYPSDYVYDTDSNLSAIILSSGVLSPEFDPAVKSYKLYVTEGTASLTVSGEAASDLATVQPIEITVTDGGVHKLICTAEDGSTCEYVLTLCYISEDNGESKEDGSTDDPLSGNDKDGSDDSTLDLDVVVLAVGAVLVATAFFVGFALAFIIKGKRKKNNKAAETSSAHSVADKTENSDDITA